MSRSYQSRPWFLRLYTRERTRERKELYNLHACIFWMWTKLCYYQHTKTVSLCNHGVGSIFSCWHFLNWFLLVSTWTKGLYWGVEHCSLFCFIYTFTFLKKGRHQTKKVQNLETKICKHAKIYMHLKFITADFYMKSVLTPSNLPKMS